MISKFSVLVLLSGSIGFAATDGFRVWEDSEVDAKAKEWSEQNLKENGATAQHEALASWRQGIVNSERLSRVQAIEFLGKAVRKSSDFTIFQVRERIEVYDAAQTALLALPGHAEYYRDRILGAQEKHKNDLTSDYAGKWKNIYFNERSEGFETLTHLPSPETVRTLGELMSNEWLPPGNETKEGSAKETPLATSALEAMCRLPLVNKPTSLGGRYIKYGDIERDLPAWRQWYEELKSGKRTFRFEGDPTEYDLEGAAPEEKLARIARDRKRDAEWEAGNRKPGTSPEDQVSSSVAGYPKPGSIAALVASCLLLAGAVWYWAKDHAKRT